MCGTVYLMFKGNQASTLSLYAGHQPILTVSSQEGIVIDRFNFPYKSVEAYDAKLHFTIKNMGSGIAHNLNYALVGFIDNQEIGSGNVNKDGQIMRTDVSILPGDDFRVELDEKSFVIAEMIDKGANETDCFAIVLSYEQHNLDGSIIPHYYLIRARPYWTDKSRRQFSVAILERNYPSSMPLNLKISEQIKYPFNPTRHDFSGNEKIHISRR